MVVGTETEHESNVILVQLVNTVTTYGYLAVPVAHTTGSNAKEYTPMMIFDPVYCPGYVYCDT